MFQNFDEFLLCRPYVGIWVLVVDRIHLVGALFNPIFRILPVYQVFWATLYILVQIIHKFAAHVTKLILLVTRRHTEFRRVMNSTILMNIK